jgi:hypothetical protein
MSNRKTNNLAAMKSLVCTLHDYFEYMVYCDEGEVSESQALWSNSFYNMHGDPIALALMGGSRSENQPSYNKGCLAICRLMRGLLGSEDDISQALEEYPDSEV